MGKQGRQASKSLIDIAKQFATEEACQNYLEALRWPNGVRCEFCGSDRISKFSTKGGYRTRKDATTGAVIRDAATNQPMLFPIPVRHLYQCLNSECKQQFTVTAGTIFNDTHLPLEKWMMAVAIMVNARKGVSAKQLQRDIGVNYRTAWYLEHRIREAMSLGTWSDQKLTGTSKWMRRTSAVVTTSVGNAHATRKSRCSA